MGDNNICEAVSQAIEEWKFVTEKLSTTAEGQNGSNYYSVIQANTPDGTQRAVVKAYTDKYLVQGNGYKLDSILGEDDKVAMSCKGSGVLTTDHTRLGLYLSTSNFIKKTCIAI